MFPMTRIDILFVGEVPEPGSDAPWPQTMMSAHPDMSKEQWIAALEYLIEQIKNDKTGTLDTNSLEGKS